MVGSLRLCALLLLACALPAQTPDTATISGQVVDGSRAAISGVQVVVRNSQTGLERRAVTNDAGQFSVAALPIGGAYSVAATKSGFAEGQTSALTLAGGATATVTLELRTGRSECRSDCDRVAAEVRGAPSSARHAHRRRTCSQEIPLSTGGSPRCCCSIAANRPAINQGDIYLNQMLFTTNGAGRRQTWFEIDGCQRQRQLGAADHV